MEKSSQEIRAVVAWPDGVEARSDWLGGSASAHDVDAVLDAVTAVLNTRPRVYDAKLTWERREVLDEV